jgi:malate dehydrogenase (oxaloacetate-decarboxylating)
VAIPSASYSITVRLEVTPDPRVLGHVTTAVAETGGAVTALDVAESHSDRLVVDLTCSATSGEHAEQVTDTLREVEGVTVRKVSDRTFLLHIGGKIEVRPSVPLRNRDDMSMAYTPGVARVCEAIAAEPEDARRLTIKRNSVAVVTDGSAVLGLGDLGPAAALPVMEGKAALFKRFADVDAWPLCLDTYDVDEIVRTVQLVAPVFGGINLEDISAPRCFEVEQRLRELLDIPVFHDDQHGTAVVVVGALLNALRVVGKALEEVRVVLAGAGAAGTAILRLLLHAGVKQTRVCDVHGILAPGRDDLDDNSRDIAERTNPEDEQGSLRDALRGADVFIGVSAPNILDGDDIATMAEDSVVFALANPVPEVDPAEARRTASVVATGRSDEPNQINNVLVFPGVFRGLLDAHARDVTLDTELAAAHALAAAVDPDQLNPLYIVPSVFDPAVHEAVAGAVRDAAEKSQEATRG